MPLRLVAITCGLGVGLLACEPPGGTGLTAVVSSATADVTRASRPPVRARAGEASSTILAADYIGPAACGDCHAEQLAAWTRGLHRTMNQRVDGRRAAPVLGDFGGAVVPYAGGEARFTRDVRGPVMTLARGDVVLAYRVTRTIGTRALQEYVGVLQGAGAPGEDAGEEVRLPFAWWVRPAGWYPQPYFDPWFAREGDFDAYAPVTEAWATRCPWCHTTYPFAQRLTRAAQRTVGHGLEQHFTLPGAPVPADPERLDVAAQVSPGISCESCHLGGRAHADGAPIHFVPLGATPRPGGPVPSTFTRERRDPAIVNTVCAQCHSGPSPRLADGTALRNSSEALDLAASPCITARCIDCHDPHAGGSDEARAIAACTTCHATYADATTGRTHAGHTTVSCLDCHMPRVVMGLDRVVRTHRISSPTHPGMLAAAAPNACNLCHLDRSIAWTVDELRRGHEVRLDPAGWTSYGPLDTPVGEVWLTGREPALRLLATDAYARSPIPGLARAMLPALLAGLDDPLPHLRVWTQLAVEVVIGRRLSAAEYDPRGPGPARAEQVRRLRATLRAPRR